MYLKEHHKLILHLLQVIARLTSHADDVADDEDDQNEKRGGFQRSIPVQHYGFSRAMVGSTTSLLRSITVPAAPWRIRAPQACAALWFHRRIPNA